MLQHKNFFMVLLLSLALITSLAPPSYAAFECPEDDGGVHFVTVELMDPAPVLDDPTARREHIFVSEDIMDMIGIDDNFASGSKVNPQIFVQIEKSNIKDSAGEYLKKIDGRYSSAVFTVQAVSEFPFRHIKVYGQPSAAAMLSSQFAGKPSDSGEYKLFEDGLDNVKDVDVLAVNPNGGAGIYEVSARVHSVAVSNITVTDTQGNISDRRIHCLANDTTSKNDPELTEHAV